MQTETDEYSGLCNDIVKHTIPSEQTRSEIFIRFVQHNCYLDAESLEWDDSISFVYIQAAWNIPHTDVSTSHTFVYCVRASNVWADLPL
jgi:hypothetical protein